ncbi:MAG: ABC transporter permease subunit, partial [Cyanobacteria bacterium]|nr:ABC transporter permease subunit [Cyanobacteriota bacterium]
MTFLSPIQRALFAKELLDVLRDYKTLLLMILVPVVVYPFFIGTIVQVTGGIIYTSKSESVKVGLVGDGAQLLEQAFRQEKNWQSVIIDDSEVKQAIANNRVNVVLKTPRGFKDNIAEVRAKAPKIELLYDGRKSNAFSKVGRVNDALRNYRSSLRQARLEELGLTSSWWDSFKFDFHQGALGGSTETVMMLATVIPYTIGLLILISAYYCSLDVVTGERERGTMSLLLTAPVKREEIMLSKFVIVFLVAIVAVALNGLSTWIAYKAGFFNVESQKSFAVVLSPLAMTMLLLLSLPFAAVITAISMYLSAFAKSYQQGAYLFLPFYLLIMVLIAISAIPNVSLQSVVALVPIANITLCMRDVISGRSDWPWIAVAMISSGIASYGFIRMAAGLLEREDILFGIKPSPEERRKTGNLRAVLCLLGIIVLLMFYVGAPTQTLDVIWGCIATQIIVLALPSVIFLRFMRLPWKQTLSLNAPPWRMMVAVVLLLPAAMFVADVVGGFLTRLFPGGESYMELLSKLLLPKDKPVWLVVFAVAIMPGICEELMFRGVMLGTLR